jgi:hypothetical protein
MTVGQGEEVYRFYFEITLNAPVVTYQSVSVTEVDGNGYPGLDPGEIAEFSLTFKNTGHAKTKEGIIAMASNNPHITVVSSSAIIPVIDFEEGRNTELSTLLVSASSDMTPGSNVKFTYFAEIGLARLMSSFSVPVGVKTESFEDGDLTAMSWVHTGDVPWSICEEEAYHGTKSLRSGAITGGQTSEISITVTSNIASTLTFRYKVSSETGNDRLVFLLNNMSRGNWSGEIEWTYFTFNINAGTNTFKWRYTKNASGDAGQDCAWIDYITFPLNEGEEQTRPILYVNKESIVFEDSEVNGVYTETFTIANLGNILMTGSVTVPTGFTLSPSGASYEVPINESKTYTLTFRPRSEIDYSGNIVILSNDTERLVYNIELVANLSNTSTVDKPALISKLHGNYPNPFNPTTSIKFDLSKSQNVEITIYNTKGQLVKQLVNGTFNAGSHNVRWDGTDSNNRSVSSGIYMYKFNTSEEVQIKKMLLLK